MATLKAGHAASKTARAAGPRAAAEKRPKRKFTNVRRGTAARKRQGQYLAALHRLKGVERSRVKAVARKGRRRQAWSSRGNSTKTVPAKAA